MHIKPKIIKINCSMLNKKIPENSEPEKNLEILLKMVDNAPQQIICSEYNQENSFCERYKKTCLYKEGWKNL